MFPSEVLFRYFYWTQKALQNGIASDNQDSFNSPVDQKCIFRGMNLKFDCIKIIFLYLALAFMGKCNVVSQTNYMLKMSSALFLLKGQSLAVCGSLIDWKVLILFKLILEKLNDIEKLEEEEKLKQKSKANLDILNKLRGSGTVPKLQPS